MNRESYNAVKAATVSIALMHPPKADQRNRPFTILGSGFCVHKDGIIVTCAHVFKAFHDPKIYEEIVQTEGKVFELQGSIPYVVFYDPTLKGNELHVHPIQVQSAVSKTDYDLAILKIHSHSAFRNGYPVLSVADYDKIHEGMEIATCGFPLGSGLEEQIGTITSSFTKGMISSIIPVPNVPKDLVRGFQLDLTATNGNSGGPVFCPETGEVFGVLQRGVIHPHHKTMVQGITKAEPIYPVFENGLIERLLAGISLPK